MTIEPMWIHLLALLLGPVTLGLMIMYAIEWGLDVLTRRRFAQVVKENDEKYGVRHDHP